MSLTSTKIPYTEIQLPFTKIAYHETGLIVDHHWEWGSGDRGIGVVSYIVLFGETTVKCTSNFFEKCFEEISAFNESVTKGLPHE